jgi:hypothetical protein
MLHLPLIATILNKVKYLTCQLILSGRTSGPTTLSYGVHEAHDVVRSNKSKNGSTYCLNSNQTLTMTSVTFLQLFSACVPHALLKHHHPRSPLCWYPRNLLCQMQDPLNRPLQILFEFHSNLCKDTHAYQRFEPNFLAGTNVVVASVSDHEVGKTNFEKPPSVEEIGQAIASMSNHKAAGLDKLFNECLKSAGKSISLSLVGLFGCVWSLEAAPSIWAKAVIHLIPKGHDVDMLLPSSYRPISLTSSVSKVFEIVLLGRLDCYAEEAELFPEEQAGFRKGRSPLEQAYILREILDHRKRMKRASTFLCFVDLQSAFPLTWREGILRRLHEVDVKGKMYRVIKSLYRNCSSAVRTDAGLTD